MLKTTRHIRVLMFAMALGTATAAGAQPGRMNTMPLGGKAFINVNGGAQTQSRTMTNGTSFPIYGQTATVQTTVGVDGGGLFDFNIGYRFMPHLGAALGFSSFSSTASAIGAASIPSPTFFNRPASVTISAVDAARKDKNVYLILLYSIPVNDKIEVSVFGGPSAIKIQQDLFAPISASNVPAGSQTITTTVRSESKTATGVNVGADISYWFMKQVGAGVFARYNGGSADLPSQAGVKAGGSQVGAGIRLKF